jgi:hypothetical protein
LHPHICKRHRIFIPTTTPTTSSSISSWNNKTYTPKPKCSKQSCQSRYIWA